MGGGTLGSLRVPSSAGVLGGQRVHTAVCTSKAGEHSHSCPLTTAPPESSPACNQLPRMPPERRGPSPRLLRVSAYRPLQHLWGLWGLSKASFAPFQRD